MVGCGGGPAALSVSVTAASSTVDGSVDSSHQNTTTLTATVANDKNAAGVTWTTSGGTLSGSTTSSTTFTAPAPTSSAQTITVTATSVADSTKTGAATITIPATPTVSTTSTSLTGAVGTAFSVQLQGSGGIAPYKNWALSSAGSALPSCLTLSSAGVLTTASGTAPTASCAGTYTNLIFAFSDSGTPTALTATSSPLTVTITAAPTIAFGASPAGTATYNVAYTSAVTATGGAGTLSYAKASGSLPPDLVLASNGAITGTPKAADIGTWTFAVTASDAYGDSAPSGNYTIVVSYPQLNVTTGTTLPSGYGNKNYSQTLAASGGSGTGYGWTVTSGASSLAALNLTLSNGGVLAGIPPVAGGNATFGVQVTDSASNTATATFSVTIAAGVSITTGTTLPAGYGNTAYSQTLAASGGSGTGYGWTVTSGASSLAALNLTLSNGGVLAGIPPVAGGSATFDVQVTDSVSNTATATFSLTINPGITVTVPILTSAYPGTAYTSAAFTASGGTGGPYTWSMAAASGSSVPTGFTINSAGAITATDPVNAGSTNATYDVVVTASDGTNQGTANATITIETAVTITTAASLPAGTTNSSYSQQLAASGGSGSGYSWTTTDSGNLASFGLTLSSTGLLSSTNLGSSSGTVNFTATVTDSQTHTSVPVAFTIAVNNALKINQTTLPPGNAGASYSQTLTASGGSGTYTNWQITSGASSLTGLGLSLNTGTGVITGTPTQSGTASFTVQVTDSSNATATQSLSILIYGSLQLTSSLPAGYTGVNYDETISGSGGSSDLTASITSALSPSNGSLAATPSDSVVTISGKPTDVNTESITVQLKDNITANTISTPYTFSISAPTTPSLPTPSSTVPGAATESQNYTGTITATGGVGPNYTWTVNGGALTNGTPVSVGNSLSVSTTGNNVLSITGTPTTNNEVSFTVQVEDNATTLTSSTLTYDITINTSGQSVGGQITWAPTCGPTPSLPTLSVHIANAGNTFAQDQSTDTNGNFTFTNVPNGTYTITPSYAGPTGSSSVFYPATQSVTVNNGALTGEGFQVVLGYTVTGTVSYGGTHTGQIYLDLVNSNCNSSGGSGTSISSAGSYTVRGVQPGTYTVFAWRDATDLGLGQGIWNVYDPSGTASVTVTTGNATGTDISLSDNDPTAAPTQTPTLNGIAGTHQGVVIDFSPATNSSNGLEAATSYDVAWSDSPTLNNGVLATTNGTFNYKANGDSNVWILNNGITGSSSFTDSTKYYFEVRANAGSYNGSWVVYGGSSPTDVTVGPPTGADTISGNVTIPAGVTVGSKAQLYVGFFSSTQGIYAATVSSPAAGSNNPFSVSVPSGTWQFFGILDQNNNGIIDTGDVTNVRNGNNGPPTVTISDSGTQDLTLSNPNMINVVQTQYYTNIYNSGSGVSATSTGYTLDFGGGAATKLPVSLALTAASNPNVLVPMDISNWCQDCGDVEFQMSQSLQNNSPNVGDTYTFTAMYGDGTSDTNLTVSVVGWNNGSTVVGAADVPTSLSPSGTTAPASGTLTQPDFSWTDPLASQGSGFSYNFELDQISGTCTSCTIWYIPKHHSSSNGFSSSITQVTWDTDPTGGSSSPTVDSLSTSNTYNWSIEARDNYNNYAQAQTWYQP